MEYKYSDDTLLHSVGFNLQRFVSVLNYGILSKNKADQLGLTFSKNYIINGQNDDYISMLRVGDINPDESISAYKLHTIFGISFIVENIDFVSDRKTNFIHRTDEVLVKDTISTDSITGIAIPVMFQNIKLQDIVIIPPDITSYSILKEITMNYVNFLKSYNYDIELENILVYFNEVKHINDFMREIKEKKDTEGLTEEDLQDIREVMADYREVIREINDFLGMETYNCFRKILGDQITLSDVVNYLSNGRYEIYNIPFDTRVPGGESR